MDAGVAHASSDSLSDAFGATELGGSSSGEVVSVLNWGSVSSECAGAFSAYDARKTRPIRGVDVDSCLCGSAVVSRSWVRCIHTSNECAGNARWSAASSVAASPSASTYAADEAPGTRHRLEGGADVPSTSTRSCAIRCNSGAT